MVFSAQTENALIASHWCPGEVADPFVWNGTCPNTFAPTHFPCATSRAGAVAALVVRSKLGKYSALNQCHTFAPVAIETAGPFGPECSHSCKNLASNAPLGKVIQLPAATPVGCSTEWKCGCSDGNYGEHHFLFWFLHAIYCSSWGTLSIYISVIFYPYITQLTFHISYLKYYTH